MGEQLLFLLFILFSVISALLERRKRKRSLAEAQRKEAGKPEEVRREVDENEEEAWPFPMGGDPFGLPRPRRSTKRQPERQSATELDEDEVEVESPVAVEEEPQPGLRERLEREARDIEEQAKQVEARVRESERKIQEAPPRRQIQGVVREEVTRAQVAKLRAGGRRKRWKVTPSSARDAIVYAEILGPPKAERKEEQFN